MAGGTLQLQARTSQDDYISGNPVLSLFKTSFKRASPFGAETKELLFNSVAFGSRSRCQIDKDGDLLKDLTLYIKLPSLNGSNIQAVSKCIDGSDLTCFCDSCRDRVVPTTFGWCNSLSHALVEEYSIEIGGMIINERFGEWSEVWNELNQTSEKKIGYNEMTYKRDPPTFKPSTFDGSVEILFPLELFFTKNTGLVLPLLALYKNDIFLNIKWRKFNELYVCNKSNTKITSVPQFSATVYADYIYLCNDDREKFIENDHLYLIEQVQRNTPAYFNKNTVNPTVGLTFKRPVKEIMWMFQRSDIGVRSNDDDKDFTYGNDWFNYGCSKSRTRNTIKDPFVATQMIFDGKPYSNPMPSIYHRLYQSYKHHTKTPSNYIYTQSFGLRPEEHQPTGTMNFSCFKQATLHAEMAQNINSDYCIKTYALSYNFVIVMNGKIAIAYQ
jgi:hypothetical protein